ncbi:MAG: hypothetical protein AABZ08_11925 [Planctomycetota bacterium]
MTKQRPSHRRLAFTTVELLVSTVLMVIAMIGVMGIFNISSGAAARTNAHAEMLEASSSLQGELAHHLSQIAPGLLIIESPPPTTVRSDVPGGPAVRRLRHDRLVFISSGSPEEFQSSIDSRRGRPDDPLGTLDPQLRPAATSREALLYFGPGIPTTFDALGAPILRNIDDAGGAIPDVTLSASEWMFMHREILLLADTGAPGWTPAPPDITIFTASGEMLDGAPLNAQIRESRMDAVLSIPPPGDIANAATLIDLIASRTVADLAGSDYGTPSKLHALWQPNWAILTPRVSIVGAPLNPPDPFPPDYYTRAGSTFIPRLADFRIEWTDGKRIDPNGADGDPLTPGDNDHRTRWFGLSPDAPSAIDPSDSASIDSMQYRARMRSIADINNPSNPNLVNPDNPPDETLAFAGIEWSPFGINSNQDAQYRAVWRTNNWNLRPKALRFTYRLYDAGSRLQQTATIDLNGNGTDDPDPALTKPIVQQRGLEFSIVVPIPE